MKPNSPAMERVSEAISALLLTHPFYGVLLLKIEIRANAAIKTARINPKVMEFNPGYVMSLTMGKLKGLLVHEIKHVALGHCVRMGARDHRLWNQATDYAINHDTLQEGFELPDGALVDAQYTSEHSAENIYRVLSDKQAKEKAEQEKQKQEQQESQSEDSGNGSGSGEGDEGQDESGQGDGEPSEDSSSESQESDEGSSQEQSGPEQDDTSTGDFTGTGPEDSADTGEAEREWSQNVAEAYRVAKLAGKLPGNIERMFAPVLQPKADWKTLFAQWMDNQSKQVTTWNKPNRRFQDIYLPGKRPEGMGEVILIIDTSGSTEAYLNDFAAVAADVVSQVEPETVRVMYIDTEVQRVDTFDQGDELIFNAPGGGGTLFQPAFDHIAREGMQPVCAVYLTDTYGDNPTDPGYPVLWVTYGAQGRKMSWGDTIAMD